MISTTSPDWIGVKLFGNLEGLSADVPLMRFAVAIHTHFVDHDISIEAINATDVTLPPKTLEIRIGAKPSVKMAQEDVRRKAKKK